MVHEKDFEDIIAKYPELIEDGLTLKGRQVTLYGRRMDLLFEDEFKRKLIVELKIGPIKDGHIGQVLSYEGMLLSAEDPTIRVMLIGNRVPPNIRRSLDHHGIAWCEITLMSLKEFLIAKNDLKFLNLFDNEEPLSVILPARSKSVSLTHIFKIKSGPTIVNANDLVSKIKSSDNYKSFWEILPMKMKNEEEARKILIKNLGEINLSHIKEIVKLVDEPYPYVKNGRLAKGPWFGRLLKSNTVYLQYESVDKINSWFKVLTDNSLSVQVKLKVLLNEPQRIKGLNVGFMTLMLYILDKKNYSIWFEGMHNGLTLFYPNLDKYSGSSAQYSTYNELAQGFASEYDFDHAELDWIFSTGIQVL